MLSSALTLGFVPILEGVATAQAPREVLRPGQDAGSESRPLSEEEAFAKAARTGEPVEVVSMRGESTEVYATPDGNLEAREYLAPVWARVDGQWKPVDTELAASGDGVVSPKATTVGLTFSGGGSNEPLVRMERAGRELALSWPGELPTPRLEGHTATYVDVIPGVDLRMGARETGFTQLLVVKTAEAANSPELEQLRLGLSAEGMEVSETGEGGLEAVDKGANNAVFEAATPLMWDSSVGTETEQEVTTLSAQPQSRALAGESGKLAEVGVEVDAERDEVVLTPDMGVLRGTDTQYPVYIDPQWYSPQASAWTFVSKYWASSPQWKFNGDSSSGMGYCGWANCAPQDVKRIFYRIPTSRFEGKSILSAEFVVRNVYSASCTDRQVELWRTKGINSSTTWNTQTASGFWIERLAQKSFAYGYDGCAAKDAEFGVRPALQEAANKGWSTMTFGLRADPGSETDPLTWKRFSYKAHLRVTYNRPPKQMKMSQLTMEYGGVCKRPGDRARVRTLGNIYASNVTDPDGDRVSVQFRAQWDSGDGQGVVTRWKPARTSSKRSGSDFAISLPSSIPEDNATVRWFARVYDGAQYSPWSYAGDPTSCYFVYDTSTPVAPAISSGEYPESNPEDPQDPWYDGVGRYGFFTLDASDDDVSRYWYGVNRDPRPANEITTSGGAARIANVLPSKPGLNFVTAQAIDEAGNVSEIRTYQFRVKAGQPERATWQLDEEAGAAEAAGSTPPRTMALHGGATPGAQGALGSAVQFNGVDGYAMTDLPAVDTSRAFAMSAWVKLSELPGDEAIVIEVPGNQRASFALYYHAEFDRWVFKHHEADASGGVVRAMADQAGGVVVGEWTHLLGSFSPQGGLELYVNGQLVGQANAANLWDARRGLILGAGLYNGTPANFLPGAVDEVQLFDKALNPTAAMALYEHQQIGDPGRPATAIFHLDEEAGVTEIAGHGGVFPARYSGGVTTGVEGIAGKAVHFNGTDGYAQVSEVAGPHVNNLRSYAVSAWAKVDPGTYDDALTVVSQQGVNQPGFTLYYSGEHQRWGFGAYESDTIDAPLAWAGQAPGTASQGTWTHLVGVHDMVAGTLSLYVNGEFVDSVAYTDPWYAGQPMLIGAMNRNGSLQRYFAGSIDDVRLFDRPVSAAEVQQLYTQRPLLTGRWMFEDVTDGSTPDDAGVSGAMTLGGGAQPGWGFIGFGGLDLDGIDDHAATTTAPIDTSKSFTVTAWAQAAAMPDGNVTVLSADGSVESAFAVRFVPDESDPVSSPGMWELAMPGEDSAGAAVSRANSVSFNDVRQWNHLAVVYDGFAKQVSLYVNGVLQEVACTDADEDGNADDPSCIDIVPWAENVLSFKATGSLQVGRTKTAGAWGEHFPGLVDDVWTFEGALSEAQIDELATNWFGMPTEVPNGV